MFFDVAAAKVSVVVIGVAMLAAGFAGTIAHYLEGMATSQLDPPSMIEAIARGAPDVLLGALGLILLYKFAMAEREAHRTDMEQIAGSFDRSSDKIVDALNGTVEQHRSIARESKEDLKRIVVNGVREAMRDTRRGR